MILSGNKGEWSEVYTLLKVIADQRLYAGDGDLNKIEHLIFPVIKVLRDESNGTFEFGYNDDLVIIKGNDDEFKIPLIDFKDKAAFLLNELKKKTKGTFSVPEIQEFINSFNCESIKAKSTVKSDIRIKIHDYRTGQEPELGFSIKSQIGGASTLLNAGKTTNFVYEVKDTPLTEEKIEQINNINTRFKIKDRIDAIHALGGRLVFSAMESNVFYNNLILIDSALPIILAESLICYYTSKFSRTADLAEEISRSNPLKFDLVHAHPFYNYKIKRFLTDVALGMMPSKVWTGELDSTGGYLIVKNDGSVLCYHIYNRNEFEDYLFKYTKFETASSTRHGFASLIKRDGKLYFNLNLQIRFL